MFIHFMKVFSIILSIGVYLLLDKYLLNELEAKEAI